jgi:hypothetical protein
LHSILNEQISLHEGSQSRKISKAEAILRRLIIGGLKGDTRDLHALFRLAEQTGQFEESRDEITKIERVVFSTVYEADCGEPSSVVPHPVNRPFNRDERVAARECERKAFTLCCFLFLCRTLSE